MPKKTNLSREQIARTAFEILRTEGYDALNARYLAQRLGVSTMPLFHHFDSMEEIKYEAVRLGVERYREYMSKGMKDPLPFKGIGRAYIKFAKEEPKLFSLFYMRADDKVKELPREDPIAADAWDVVTEIMHGDRDEGARLLRSMWLLVHGIATLEATGKMSFSDDEMGEILSYTFAALKDKTEGENK